MEVASLVVDPSGAPYNQEVRTRTGTAQLPLHGGRAPAWLYTRMVRLAREITIHVSAEFGPEEMLRRLSDPFWFQAFGCVLGFDWHSSGVTTTVCGALKAGLAGREQDIGLWVAGGKGRASRKTPAELERIGAELSLDGSALAYASRMSAKVDSAAVQDGFALYHHAFFVTAAGRWGVVQQGMRDGDGSARRYHWLGERVDDFVVEPHAAIASDARADLVLDLTARESQAARDASAALAREEPDRILREAQRAAADADVLAMLRMPRRHAVDVAQDVNPRHLRKVLIATYEAEPRGFEELLAVPGVGAKAVRALALLAEIVHGSPASVRDPARFSFAHGGKDGHPYPVDQPTYDASIEWLEEAISRARVGRTDRVEALRRLARWQAS